MSQLQIRLFGGFQVHLDEQPIRFPTQKVRALFAYLSVEAKSAHPREKLMTLFWPEQSQNSASNNLRQTLSRLRAVLPADTLLLRDNEIQFNPQREVNLDVARFLSLIETKSKHTQTVAFDDPGWLRQAEAAASLYRGDFLAHFAVADCAEFEEWVLLKREWLRRCVNDLFFQCARVLTGLYNFDQALHYTWRQIELDTLNEEAHHQFIHILALAGRKSEAIAHYEYCRNLLKAELGVEPAQSTSALYERILHNEIGTDAETRISSGVQNLAPPVQAATQASNQKQATTNFPAQLLPLIGREREVAACLELLSEPAIRLVTILGAGGMGKTHLAIEVGQQIINAQSQQFDATLKNSQLALHRPDANFTDGVYFVSLVALLSPDAIVATIAAAMDFTFRSEVDPLLQLQDYLRSRNVLLIVDNFEHLLAGAATLVDLLSAAPRVKALVTSRAALNVTGEQLFPLDGLEYPRKTPLKEQSTSVNIESLSLYGAVRLFSQSAHRLNPAFRLDDSNGEAIATICRLVQGMPLSLLLSAAWIPLLTPAAIVEQLTPPLTPSGSSSLDFLESDWRGMNERQRSLRLVFERSWQLLTAELQLVFARLAIFRGGFRFETAQIITKISLRQLLVLVNHSLVRRADDGRYDLHELIRQYAEEKMERAQDGDATRQAHADHYANLIATQGKALRTAGELDALALLDSEIENVRAGWNWLARQANYELLQQMIEGVCWFYNLRRRLHEGLETLQSALDAIETQGRIETLPPQGKRLGAALLLWSSDFQPETTPRQTLAAIHFRVETLLNHSDMASLDIRNEKAFLLLLQSIFAWRDDLDSAEKLARESLKFYQELDILARVGDLFSVISGVTYGKAGPTNDAKEYLQQSLQIRQLLGDRRGIAYALQRTGQFAHDNGNFNLSESLQRKVLDEMIAIGSPGEIGGQCHSLGNILNLNGKFSEAIIHLEQARSIWRTLGAQGDYAHTTDEYVYCRLNMGDYEGRLVQIQEAVEILHVLAIPPVLPYGTLASVYLLEGKLPEAQHYAQLSVDVSRRRAESALALNLGYQSYVEYAAGNHATAIAIITEALQIARKIGHAFDASIAFGALAWVWVDEHKFELAIEILGAAYQFPAHRHSRWYADIAGNHIHRCAAAVLSPEQIEVAKNRGLTRNIWETVDWVLGDLSPTDSIF